MMEKLPSRQRRNRRPRFLKNSPLMVTSGSHAALRVLPILLLALALIALSACSTLPLTAKPPALAPRVRPLTSVTIFTKTPIRLSLERLRHLAQDATSDAETFAISPTKRGETPFLVVVGETEVRILCGYEGDFPSYLDLALRPAVKASAGSLELEEQLDRLAKSYKDVIWLQIVPSEDKEGKVRALIRKLAEETGGAIYSQASLYLPNGSVLWSASATQALF
jgi:hypothetical protein